MRALLEQVRDVWTLRFVEPNLHCGDLEERLGLGGSSMEAKLIESGCRDTVRNCCC